MLGESFGTIFSVKFNLQFIEEVDEFKMMKERDEMKKKALRIKNKFIGTNSRSPVNIAGVVVEQIQQDFTQDKIDTKIFDTAREQVYHLLKVDPFPRFVTYMRSQ